LLLGTAAEQRYSAAFTVLSPLGKIYRPFYSKDFFLCSDQ
jgi:hypothetical protein